jgi:hypothetical protein
MSQAREAPRFFISRLCLGLFLALLGALCLSDVPGLRSEYFALTPNWSGLPVFTSVSDPQLGSRDEVAEVLVSQEIFSLRWQGWILAEQTGSHRFAIKADEAAYLRIDGDVVANVTDAPGARSGEGVVELTRGIHAIDIGVSQTRGRSLLEARWEPPGGRLSWLRGQSLFAHPPVRLRSTLRRLTRGMPRGVSQGLGGVSLVGGLILLVGALGSVTKRWRYRMGPESRPPATKGWVVGLVLLVLFAIAALASFPYTSATADGDDVRYMDGALFNKQMGWNMNRYAHIYMLKGFTELARGDVFLASRVQWAFMFGLTVAALGLAVKSLGPRLQWSTLVVVLFLLLSQPRLLGGIGAAYADYTAMMFVTLGLAVYLHGYATQPTSSSRWHALALGLLTIGAGKSKEPGAIMLWFVFLLLWSGGRVDVKRFARRLLWWGCGAVAAYLVLMSLDGLVLGDFWFSLRPSSFAGAGKLLEAAEGKWQLSRFAWLSLPWSSAPLRGLSIVALLAAVSAWLLRRPMELRLVALTPLVFMVMMIAVHPPTLTPRYLFPIVPVTCFVGGMMAFDLALNPGKWKGLLSARTVVMLALLGVLFLPGFLQTRAGLARHTAYQRGELTLYPWRVFEAPISQAGPKQIIVSKGLFSRYQMLGKKKTRDRLARMYFRRRHLELKERSVLSDEARPAVLDRQDYRRWRASRPDSGARILFDPSGRVVLVLPE